MYKSFAHIKKSPGCSKLAMQQAIKCTRFFNAAVMQYQMYQYCAHVKAKSVTYILKLKIFRNFERHLQIYAVCLGLIYVFCLVVCYLNKISIIKHILFLFNILNLGYNWRRANGKISIFLLSDYKNIRLKQVSVIDTSFTVHCYCVLLHFLFKQDTDEKR